MSFAAESKDGAALLVDIVEKPRVSRVSETRIKGVEVLITDGAGRGWEWGWGGGKDFTDGGGGKRNDNGGEEVNEE